MSIGLTIIPVINIRGFFAKDSVILGYNRLAFKPSYAMFSQLRDNMDEYDAGNVKIPTFPLPENITVILYEDEGIKEKGCDDGLIYAYAGDLQKLSVPEDDHPLNKAIKAFIDALPGDTLIILEWT